jgi:hypothetical protein
LLAQAVVALIPEKRMNHRGQADWMMHPPVGEAMPELEHLRSDAASSRPCVSRKIIGDPIMATLAVLLTWMLRFVTTVRWLRPSPWLIRSAGQRSANAQPA